MKIFIYLLILNSTFLWADSSPKDMFEKTWPRANSACSIGKKRVEIFIRGGSKFTETKDYGFGEYVFYKVNGKLELFNFAKSPSTLYRFYKASAGSSCSKTQGYPLGDDKFAILLGEDNKPNPEKLIIQIFDFKTMTPVETIDTHLLVEKAYHRPGGFIFKCLHERYEMDMGKVTIGSDKLIYQDRIFPVWRFFDGKNIIIDPSTTFHKLPWRKYFSDESDFLKSAAWDMEKKNFSRPVVYFAGKPGVKRKCILFTEKKMKLNGTEEWHCH